MLGSTVDTSYASDYGDSGKKFMRAWWLWLRPIKLRVPHSVFLAAVFTSSCIPFGCCQARDARHLGQYGPEGQACSGLVLLVTM